MDVRMQPPEDDSLPPDCVPYAAGSITDEQLEHIYQLPPPPGRTIGDDKIPPNKLLVTPNGVYDLGFYLINASILRLRKFFTGCKGNSLHSRVAFLVYGHATTPDWAPTPEHSGSFHPTWYRTMLSFVGNIFDREAQRKHLIGWLRTLTMDTVS